MEVKDLLALMKKFIEHSCSFTVQGSLKVTISLIQGQILALESSFVYSHMPSQDDKKHFLVLLNVNTDTDE